MVANDDLSVSTTGEFSDKNVATDKTVTFGTLTLGGADANNYIIKSDSQTTTTADITVREITVSGITAENKVYDGDVTATVDTTNAVFGNMVANDDLTVSTTGEFSDKNVATGKTVTLGTLTLGGADANNYIVKSDSQTTATADITVREVTVSGITAADKVFDGTTAATVDTTAAVFGDMIDGDVLSVSTTGAFADEHAGTDKTVTFDTLVLGGDDAANYIIKADSQTTTTADITALETAVVWNDVSVTYNGTDQVSAITGYYVDVNGNQVAVEVAIADGAAFCHAGDYTAEASTADADYALNNTTFAVTMNRADLTVTADAVSVEEDGTIPELTWTTAGLVSGDRVNGKLATDADVTEPGEYAITQGTVTDANNPDYNVTFVPGVLTVTEKTLPEGGVQNDGTLPTPSNLNYTSISGALSDSVDAKIREAGNRNWSVPGSSVSEIVSVTSHPDELLHPAYAMPMTVEDPLPRTDGKAYDGAAEMRALAGESEPMGFGLDGERDEFREMLENVDFSEAAEQLLHKALALRNTWDDELEKMLLVR